MRVGGLMNVGEEPGAFLTSAVLKVLNLDFGDYIDIENDEHGTRVSRRIRSIRTSSEMCDDYVYLDRNTLRYLDLDLHTQVSVSAALFSLDVP